MNILFDFVTVRWCTGAGEYQKTVFFSLMKRIDKDRVFALWDSTKGIAYPELSQSSLKSNNIEFVDISKNGIENIIETNHIDVFFIACGQYMNDYPGIENIKCKTICIIHDVAGEDIWDNNLSFVISTDIRKIRNHLIKRAIGSESKQYALKSITKLYTNNSRCYIATPSEYTRLALLLQYKINPKRIFVHYSPQRCISRKDSVENDLLRSIITKGTKYYLLLNANRSQKNPEKVIEAFSIFSQFQPESYLITVQYNGSQKFPNHIIVPFLNESDLEYAFENAYALIYPSIYEGFGYPPVEIMRYSKPVLASNVTSIPEILGDAPIYFSPFYVADILKALFSLNNENYAIIASRSFAQYNSITNKQQLSIAKIVDMIKNQ